MSSVCADQHKFLPFSPKKSLIRDIDIPPRKLLSRRAAVATAVHDGADMYSDSPRFSSAEEAFLQKFLPHNIDSDSDDGSDDSDPYSSDHFRMYEFKVRQCTRSRSHDWTDCPFAHPGEKARRRDPRRFHYSGTVCPEYRRGGCSRGDGCDFAHGVFECWLHPARYRTEACKDGKNCKRKVCFFAHTPRQLRILPVNSHNNNDNNNSSISSHHHISKNTMHSPKFLSPNNSSSSNNCCLFCHHCAAAAANNSTLSPTSTLFSQMSPPLSPPLSPAKRRAQAVSRYCDRFATAADNNNHHGGGGVVSYKDVVTELMSSLDGLNFIESNSPTSSSSSSKPPNLPWLDISLINSEDPYILSPSTHSHNHTPITTSSSSVSASSFSNGGNLLCNSKIEVNNNNSFFSGNHDIINGSSSSPDLAWVNELLM